MNTFTSEHLVHITEEFLKHKSPIKAQRSFQNKFHPLKPPSTRVIERCFRNFRQTGSINRGKPTGRPISHDREDCANQVSEMITANSNLSVRRVVSCQLNIKIVQELSPVDYDKRMSFSRWFLEQVIRDQSFVDALITSDEAHFHLNGFVNRQNFRYWCDHNPEEIVLVEYRWHMNSGAIDMR